MGEVLTYKFGRKNNWRNRCWNEIRAGIKNPAEAKVLYLCGPEDLDREVAIRKGFKERNLFAVSNDKKVVAALRAKKRNVICGDIIEVAQSFGEKVDVLHLDLCSGLTRDADRIIKVLMLSVKRGGMFLLNLQRGRDAETNFIRDAFSFTLDFLGDGDKKHRGLQFYLMLFFYAFFSAKLENGVFVPNSVDAMSDELDAILAHPGLLSNMMFEFATNMLPKKHFSYKSNVVVMDSIIIKNNLFDLAVEGGTNFFVVKKDRTVDESGSLMRQIAAVKAVNTRRFGKCE